MRVFILTEGGSKIGLGHVTRCISIYQAFEEKGIKPTLLVNGDETVRAILKDKEHVIFDWLKENERLCDMIRGADISIMDSYLANSKSYQMVSQNVKAPAYIDDNDRIDYPGGILVNGTIYADRYFPKRQKCIKYLLGTAYIPLRKAFWEVTKKKINEALENITITFGGEDPKGMTPRVLRSVTARYPDLVKRVVIGKGFDKIEEIKAVKDRNTELIYYPGDQEMRDLLLSSDMAISAGGQTLYELARVGVPTIAIAVAENQLNNVNGWKRIGFAEYAGLWNEENVLKNILESIEYLKDKNRRFQRSAIGKRYVDGRGALRIRDILMRSSKIRTVGFGNSKDITLSAAAERDRKDIWLWRNHPDVRRWSFNEEPISWDEHNKWFDLKLASPDTRIYVATSKNSKIGGSKV